MTWQTCARRRRQRQQTAAHPVTRSSTVWPCWRRCCAPQPCTSRQRCRQPRQPQQRQALLCPTARWWLAVLSWRQPAR
jgi:hypothetical protein